MLHDQSIRYKNDEARTVATDLFYFCLKANKRDIRREGKIRTEEK